MPREDGPDIQPIGRGKKYPLHPARGHPVNIIKDGEVHAIMFYGREERRHDTRDHVLGWCE